MKAEETLIPVARGDSIYEVHPFFESLYPLEECSEDKLVFNCVHIHSNDTHLITDISIVEHEEGFLVFIHDLTHHYSEYQKVTQIRNESILAEELAVLKNLEYEQRERFKNIFIQNFSHELRNPLTSIMAITEVLGNTSLTIEQKKMLDFLKDSNTHLRLLLEDILSLSVINSGHLKLENKLFSLSKMLELLKFTYRAKAKRKGLEFSLSSDDRVPELIEGDKTRLYQVLVNLLDNAEKYTQEGHFSLQVQCNQKRAGKVSLRFTVTDTGIGIPKENHTKIFESFNRVQTSDGPLGVGLGLSIVKGLLEHMGSAIIVSSGEEGGSTFYFDIVLKYPLHTAHSLKVKRGYQTFIENRKDLAKRKYRLLLVEDDERVQTAVLKWLMDIGEFYIDLVEDGSQVIEQLIGQNYDIMLLDVNLPNVSGDEITRVIRSFPFKNIKNIPIIGLTAYAFEEDIQRFLKAGMNQVISKPFDQEELHRSIKGLLR